MGNSNHKKECPSIRVLLSSYIDNELDEQQSDYVTEHLAHCSSCKHELSMLYKMNTMISSVYTPVDEDSIDLSRKIMTKIRYNEVYNKRKTHSKRNILKSKLAYLSAVAVVMLLSIGGTVTYFQGSADSISNVKVRSVAFEQDRQYESYALEHYSNSYSSSADKNSPIVSVNFEK